MLERSVVIVEKGFALGIGMEGACECVYKMGKSKEHVIISCGIHWRISIALWVPVIMPVSTLM